MSKTLNPTEIAAEVRYAFEWPTRYFTPVSPAACEVIRDFVLLASKTRPLSEDDTGIVSMLKPKTAALLADRVWLQYPGDQDLDLDFAFGWESPMAVRLGALLALIRVSGDSSSDGDNDTMALSENAKKFLTITEGSLARDYGSLVGATISPLYDSCVRRNADYRPGNVAVVISVVENVGVVSETALEWDQVLEFRRDIQARNAYQRFLHWLDAEMVGKPVGFIADEISQRLDEYSWALKKHGLQTVIGALERTVSAHSLFGSSAAAVAIEAVADQPLLAALGGAGLLVSQAGIYLATSLVAREDVIAINRDIAFVHEIRTQMRKP